MTGRANEPVGEPVFFKITSGQVTQALSTQSYFSIAPAAGVSPIDEFLANAYELNKMYLKYEADPQRPRPPSELAGLIVLGYMSAAESYFRALVRNLINIDELVHTQFHQKQLSFAAAVHHQPTMLPDALYEGISLSDPAAVTQLYKTITNKKSVPADIEQNLDEYKKVCEIRHCCVHRFGRLGMNNAIQLGLREHKGFLEFVFAPQAAELSQIASVMINFIQNFNGVVFKDVLLNTVHHQYLKPSSTYTWKWMWHLPKDKKRFATYYDLFSIKVGVPASPSLRETYNSFRDAHRAAVMAKMGAPPGAVA